MSDEHTFTCTREMTGDKAYAEGDTRRLLAVDASHLVRSGALVPKGKAAEDAMAELLGNEPWKQSEVVMQVKDDAPNNKAMGNAPANKGGTGGRKGAAGVKAANASPTPPTPPATPAAAAPAGPAAPAVPNVGQDGGAPATPAPAGATPGEGGGVTEPATGDAGPAVAAVVTAPAPTGKRR